MKRTIRTLSLLHICLFSLLTWSQALAGDASYSELVSAYKEIGLFTYKFDLDTKSGTVVPGGAVDLKLLNKSKSQNFRDLKRGETVFSSYVVTYEGIHIWQSKVENTINYLGQEFVETAVPISHKVISDELVSFADCKVTTDKVEKKGYFTIIDKGEYYFPTKEGLIRSRYVELRTIRHGTYGVLIGGEKLVPLAIIDYRDNKHAYVEDVNFPTVSSWPVKQPLDIE